MFDWFRKRSKQKTSPPQPADAAALYLGVAILVTFLQARPNADDEAVVQRLVAQGLSEEDATKLIQFTPIAFTRFLYRNHDVRFAPNYVLLDANAKPVAQHPVADEPAYQAAWKHCEEAATTAGNDYFVAIAARSGGYQAIQDLLQKGVSLSGLITSPPMMWR